MPADIPIPTGKASKINNSKSTWFAETTNGLVYESIILRLPEMTEKETALLSLYTDCLTELGAGRSELSENANSTICRQWWHSCFVEHSWQR